jgi:rRNA-processing protein FCF1
LTKVVFDSSFLIAVVERPTTWYDDITDALGRLEPATLDCVLSELDALSKKGGKRAKYASLAKSLTQGFEVGKCGQSKVDDEILSYARTNSAVVATVDQDLIRTLKKLGIGGVTLRRHRVSVV